MTRPTEHVRGIGSLGARRAVAAALALGAAVPAAGAVSAATRHTATVVVSTVKTAKLGTYLVSGKTVYTLSGGTCTTAACLKVWPELVLPKGVLHATAGKGVSAAKLGTVPRAGGVLQVTYGGKALFFYVGDAAPGQVRGNIKDTWGKWSDVVTVKPTSSGAGGGAGTGGNTGSGGVAF